MEKLPHLDGEQLLEDLHTLAQFGRSAEGGLNRIGYSAADLEARQWVIGQLEALGLQVRVDAAGNTIATYAGTADLSPIALGSHTDTVPEGGDYDGSLGVLSALAAVRALKTAERRLRHPVEIINFAAEEATLAGGTTGSQAMAGRYDAATFDKAAWDGRPVRTHLQEAGLDLEAFMQAGRPQGSLAAFVELHIEQGDRLIAAERQIGIVEGIVSIRRYAVVFDGYANHAGTTPMDRRQDALVTAAPFITFVHDTAVKHDIVGTIGQLTVLPGAPNVIPGRVALIVEIRGLEAAVLDQAAQEMAAWMANVAGSFTPVADKPAVQSDPRLIKAMTAACEQLGLSYELMPSGAGHDAMNLSYICPQGMLFVPSQGGVSHSPDEYTKPEDCINGAQILLATLVALDEMLDETEVAP